jgi:chromosome segregation ATPase
MARGFEDAMMEFRGLVAASDPDSGKVRDFFASGHAADLLAALEDATTATTQAKAELAREQGRLLKLWDAYRTQESEILEGRRRAGETERLRADLEASEAQIRALEERLAAQSALAAEVQRVRELEERAKAAEAERNADRERLAKLYAAYEDVESERDKLRKDLEQRAAWFAEHKEALDELVRAIRRASSAGGNHAEMAPAADAATESGATKASAAGSSQTAPPPSGASPMPRKGKGA